MKINGKTYCDVCLKDITNEIQAIFKGEDLDSKYLTQERHYCKTHSTWAALWDEIKNGTDIGYLSFPSKNENKENKETFSKEVSTLELYNILSGLFEKHYNYLVDITIPDKDIQDYCKQILNADITYNRMKTQGKIKEDKTKKEKEEVKC